MVSLLQRTEQFIEIFAFLQIAKAGRVRRRNIDRYVVSYAVNKLERRKIVFDSFLIRNVFVLANVDADDAAASDPT